MVPLNLEPTVFYPQQHLQYNLIFDAQSFLLNILLLISSGPGGLNVILYNSERASPSTTIQYTGTALHSTFYSRPIPSFGIVLLMHTTILGK